MFKSLGRKIGIVGLALGWGVACTQLFGDERQNTLADIPQPNLPGMAPMQQPGGVAAICATGEKRCDGALLQTCADDGASWVTLQRCAAAALCQGSPGACLSATCSVDEMTCAGSVLQKCNADRTGWELFATCLSPAHCNAGQRQCLPEPCAAGERRCDRSESDQSPVLEVCRDDRQDWGPLDACVTRELCDQTLTSGGTAAPVPAAEGRLPVQPLGAAPTVVSCLLPACAVGEVRCEGARLEFCSEGRTGWNAAEECASAALCEASQTSAGVTGTPQCLAPACAVGQHQCSATGVLQVCSEDRTGFVDQEACIGPPFCNAAVADRGEAGCLEAPCEAGVMQCNGAQIQVCRDDRTALDNLGAPCESAALCNADDPTNAFCEDPVCRRGATSGDEFRCEGAELQRCNESLTIYDTIQTCVTPALCDASQRANGCKTPACQPDQHSCSGGFLQTCNADQTAFENTENCGSQAQCDANAGRCADPCEIGSQRCNATTGDLEQCNDLLTGWQPIADCPNVQLCDLPNGRCDICFGDQFSCADNQLRQCSPDGGTFRRQNIGPECAALPNNAGVGVRVCQNNAVVVTPCQFGCTNGVCFQCQPNTSQCVNGNQVRLCNADGTFGATTSCADSNQCDGAETCNPQTNSCNPTGVALTCNDGNRCTSDTCNPNPGGGCRFPAVADSQQCAANALLQRCVNGQTADTQCNMQLGCLANQCAVCGIGQCNGNQFVGCQNGQFVAPVNCTPDTNVCTNDTCTPQGCQRPPVANGTSCADNNACNGNETCQNGNCNNPADLGENAPCGGGNTCQSGQCRPLACTPNTQTRCQNGLPERCNAQGTGFTRLEPTCDDEDACTTDGCNAQQAICTHDPITTGACAPAPECTAGQTRCQAGVPQRCGADGSFATVAACEFLQNQFLANACAGNTLRPDVCIINQATCVANGATGSCVTRCVANSTQRCNGTQPQICNATGDAFRNMNACEGTSRPSCNANGTIVFAPCDNNPRDCIRGVCNAAQTACLLNPAPLPNNGILVCDLPGGGSGNCSGTTCLETCSANDPCPTGQGCNGGFCGALPG